MAERALTPCPYKGLMPYDDADFALFHGRAAEREIIIANLIASRLTVLYGMSGVGKTSLLRAGVVHHLNEQARARIAAGRVPEFVVVPFASWRDDSLKMLVERVRECVAAVMPGSSLGPAPGPMSLAAELQWLTESTGPDLLVLLDQFEEYFVYHPDGDPSGFPAELAGALSQPGLRANFLISIREDALSRLDRFKAGIPRLFANVLRVEHLDLKGARDAIEKPIAWYNLRPDTLPISLDPVLVDEVLEQTRSGSVIVGEGARGAVKQPAGASAVGRVETPFLQLVMTRLWDDPRTAAAHALSVDTLRALGGAAQIVEMHMRETLGHLSAAEQSVAASIFRYLVTPSGTKVAHTAADLASFAGLTLEQVSPVIGHLSSGDSRLLRSIDPPPGDPDAQPRYQIFHDVLAKPILDWRGWHAQEQARQAQERAHAELEKERRWSAGLKRWVTGLTFTVTLLVILAVALIWVMRLNASQGKALARGREVAEQQAIAATALAKLSSSPDLSLLLALAAAETELSGPRPPEVVDALRRALVASHALKPIFLSPEQAGLITAVFSPQNNRIAAATDDGSIIVWDAQSGEVVLTRALSKASVGLAVSPDGRFLGVADYEGYLSILDATSGEQLARERAPSNSGGLVAFGRGGLVATGGQKQVTVWRMGADHHPVPILDVRHPSDVTAVAFSADGQQLGVATTDGIAYVWSSTQPGKWLHALRSDDQLDAVAFSPDGTRLAVGGMAKILDVWDLNTETKRQFTGHYNTVFAVEFSPDGSKMASSSADSTVRIWSTRTGQTLFTLAGHAGPVQRVAFSPDGARALTAGWDGTARWWNVAGHAGPITGLALSLDGSVIASGGEDGSVIVWDAHTGQEVRDLGTAAGQVANVGFSGDGSRLMALNGSGTARIWSEAAWSRVADVHFDAAHAAAHDESLDTKVVSASLNSDGTLLAIGDSQGWVHVQQLSTGKWLCKAVSRYREQIDAVFEPAGSWLATTGALWDLQLWDTSHLFTTRLMPPLRDKPVRPHEKHVFRARFSHDGRWLATSSLDKTARIWDARTLTMERELTGHDDAVNGVAFSPDGARVATASWDHKVRVFDRTTGALQMVIGHDYPVREVVFSSDGTRLITSSVVDVRPQIHLLDESELLQYAHDRAPRVLTAAECETYLHHACPPTVGGPPAGR